MRAGRAALAALLAFPIPAGAGTAARSTDADIPAAVAGSWGPQASFFRGRPFEMVSWGEARRVLLGGECAGGKQYHTGWVTIYAKDGTRYLVRPPDGEDLFSFFRRHGLKGEGFAPE